MSKKITKLITLVLLCGGLIILVFGILNFSVFYLLAHDDKALWTTLIMGLMGIAMTIAGWERNNRKLRMHSL